MYRGFYFWIWKDGAATKFAPTSVPATIRGSANCSTLRVHGNRHVNIWQGVELCSGTHCRICTTSNLTSSHNTLSIHIFTCMYTSSAERMKYSKHESNFCFRLTNQTTKLIWLSVLTKSYIFWLPEVRHSSSQMKHTAHKDDPYCEEAISQIRDTC